MTDPHHPQARMLGDVKFHEHNGIDAQAAERFQQRGSEALLAPFTVQIARSFGYDLAVTSPSKAELQSTPDSNTIAKPFAGRSALVAIQSRGTRPPIFCMHPAGGTVLCYREFAAQLGCNHPVYGLQSIGAHGKHRGLTSIEAMATDYIREIRNVQPEGPYHLVGWSLGGVVAYEMAQQLKEKNQQIAFLGLLDSDLPRLIKKSRGLAERRFLVDFAHQCGLDISVEALQNLELSDQLPVLLEKAKLANLLPSDLSLERFRQLYERNSRIFRANVRALRRYAPRPYSGRVVLLRAAEKIGPSISDPQSTWESLADQIDVHVVPGNHYTMICTPLVVHLVDHIRKYLPT